MYTYTQDFNDMFSIQVYWNKAAVLEFPLVKTFATVCLSKMYSQCIDAMTLMPTLINVNGKITFF